MIELLPHKEPNTAGEVFDIFQASYKVEADFLQVRYEIFPPLKRTIEQFLTSKTDFYGYYHFEKLAGILEVDKLDDTTQICSLVVHPSYFRQGIARQLLDFAVSVHETNEVIVETGYANKPAMTLYERYGFEYQGRYLTPIGVEKGKFKLQKK